jgi:CRP/FNR family transcriptional regulator, cyclic AMP receptor protein
MSDSPSPIKNTNSMILNALHSQGKKSLLAEAHQKSYQKGQTIFSRGEKGGWLFLIEEGLVEISIMSLGGRKSVLNHLESGDVLGEVALFDKQGRSADAIAITAVTGTVIQGQSVFKLLENNNEAFYSIIETLCARVRNASEMYETQSLPSARSRLARCLIRVAKKWGEKKPDGSIHIKQALTQSDLGELAGIARENVNRYLQSWSSEQLILFDKGNITILAPDKLADLAEL